MTIIIQPGKRYVTRGGDVTGVLVKRTDGIFQGFLGSAVKGWFNDGCFDWDRKHHPFDLISEYTEPSAEGATVSRRWLQDEIQFWMTSPDHKTGGAKSRVAAFRLALERLDQIEPEKPKPPTIADRLAAIILEEEVRKGTWRQNAAKRILYEVARKMVSEAYIAGHCASTRKECCYELQYSARTIAAAIGDEP